MPVALFLLFNLQLRAQEQIYTCADDIAPGSQISRSENDYISCLILEGKNQATLKKKTYRRLQRDFIRHCSKDQFCRNNLFKTELLDEKCFNEDDKALCHIVIKFARVKTKYDQKVDVKEAVIKKDLYKDKTALHLGFTPTFGWMADFVFRKTHLSQIGWQLGLALYQRPITVGEVGVTSTNPLYANSDTVISMAGYTAFGGISYNFKIGNVWAVPLLNLGFTKIQAADDPWFGKDRIDTSYNEIPHELTSSFTYFLSGSLMLHFDTKASDSWFIKGQIAMFGEAYAPLFMTLGIGKQFNL